MADPFDLTLAPVTEPEQIIIGSYTAWQREIDIDDTDYSLAYRFVPLAGGTTQTLSGTLYPDTICWQFEALSSVTATWAAGEYRWDLIITRLSDSETMIQSSGFIQLFTSTGDRRSHAEIMVSKIESLLQGRADNDIENYTIKNRSLTKMSIPDLMKWRDYYADEVRRTGGSTTGVSAPNQNTVRVKWVS